MFNKWLQYYRKNRWVIAKSAAWLSYCYYGGDAALLEILFQKEN